MDNIYHRYLNIPYEPGIDLMSTVIEDETFYKHITFDHSLLNPDLIKWFKQFDIKFTWYEAFYTPPNGGKISIHTDLAEISNIAKINWTWGAPGSKMIWWEVDDHDKIVPYKSDHGDSIFLCEEQHCRKVFEKEISLPSLVNAGRFHSTYNPSNEKRWTMSLPIYDTKSGSRLSWQEGYERLKSFIIE